MADVEDEIVHLKRALKVELDRDLALALEIDRSAVAAWRRRGKVPERYLLRYPTVGARITYDDPIQSLPRAYIFSLLVLIAGQISRRPEFSSDETDDFELAFEGMRLASVHDRLAAEFRSELTPSAQKERYQQIKADVMQGDIREWLATVTAHRVEGPQ